ncbi:OppA family ABC transporter substrate-binding lipoprotein [Mycoplasmopsis columbinasalis]|uniref:Lipoprotein n=1 Tax=Mycoplasmopsis columbinasalis TaxID=114880 RepID=A0A449B9V1_9BACT|nr:hypothetical protein [Mycoplasmopsis columbinasalis]VEU77936.1 Uncharacterised protein [Mycoplasmopsis columbinasalis]
MKLIKKLSLLTTMLAPAIATTSCNIREAAASNIYIKKFNSPNNLKTDFVINKVGKVTNDFESLLHSPLLKWTYDGKAKYDSINKQFYNSSLKYLSFGLARLIILVNDKKEENVFLQDSVQTNNHLSTNETGIKQVFSDNKQNINSEFFFETLKKAVEIRIQLKNNILYVNNNGEFIKGLGVRAIDYYTSFKNDWDNTINLFTTYQLETPKAEDFVDKSSSISTITFRSLNTVKPELSDFVLNEIPNNLIFNPLLSSDKNPFGADYGKTLDKTLFTSPYYLAYNSFEQQIFKKNPHFVDSNFVKNSKKLEKIVLNYNLVPQDLSTFQLQQMEGFKQNLVTEVEYNVLNSNQKEEVDTLPVLFNLTYATDAKDYSNSVNLFWNVSGDFETNEQLFSKAFGKIVLGNIYDQSLSGEESEFFFPKRFELRHLLNLITNPNTFQKLINNRKYWNNVILQNANLNSVDSESFSTSKLIDYESFVNNFYDLNFATKTISFISDFEFEDAKNAALLSAADALKSPYFSEFKTRIIALLNFFYDYYHFDKQEKFSWTIPVFATKNKEIETILTLILNNIKSIDERLEPRFEFFAKTNKKTPFVLQKMHFENLAFSNIFASLLFRSDLFFWAYLLKARDFVVSNDKEFTSWSDLKTNGLLSFEPIKKVYMWIETNFKPEVFSTSETSLATLLSHSKNLKTITDLKLDFANFLKTFSRAEQLDLIKVVNLIFDGQISIDSYIQANSYSKQLIQITFEKPLNDLGYTQYQDINYFG